MRKVEAILQPRIECRYRSEQPDRKHGARDRVTDRGKAAEAEQPRTPLQAQRIPVHQRRHDYDERADAASATLRPANAQ